MPHCRSLREVCLLLLVLAAADASRAQTLVKDINPGATGSFPAPYFPLGSEMLFPAEDGTTGSELWITDGTEGGTQLVKDINSGPAGSSPTLFVPLGASMIFRADDGTNGNEIWKTDGTEGGTVLVKNIHPSGSSLPLSLTAFGGAVFFRADDGTDGPEVWKTDGTDVGTVQVADVFPGATGSFPGNFTEFAGALFFTADDGTNGGELWKTDGTTGGTVLVKDINTDGGSTPAQLTPLNGLMCFNAFGSSGFELYATDGTTGGTDLVMDINPGSDNHSFPANLTAVGSLVFFTANDGTNGTELWKTDCTTANTEMVKDINPGGSSSPAELVDFNGQLAFRANDGSAGTELWISDGTSEGTVMVKDIQPGASSSLPSELFVLPDATGTLYFRANDGTNGVELWKSDGTEVGTVMVSDYNPGAADSFPLRFANLGGLLLFAAENGTNGREPTLLDPSLPVELASFSATADGFDVVLRWETMSERNNSGFDVQYQADTAWETLAFVAGAGNSTDRLSYEYRVADLASGTHQFRLKQIDFDGTFEYSPVVEVTVAGPLRFSLEDAWPNPFNPATTIRYALPRESAVRLSVFDVLGREVRVLVTGPQPTGRHELVFDASDLPAGAYFYRLQAGGFEDAKGFVLLR